MIHAKERLEATTGLPWKLESEFLYVEGVDGGCSIDVDARGSGYDVRITSPEGYRVAESAEAAEGLPEAVERARAKIRSRRGHP